MSDFNTIPARPLSEKPEEEPEKKEEKKPAIEVEDWSNEPPAPEPDFFKKADDSVQTSGHPQRIEPEDAQSAKTMAFEQMIPVESKNVEPPQIIESLPIEEPKMDEPKLPEPVFHIPQAPKPVEPEVLETPAYRPNSGATPPPNGEPPKKNKVWLIVLIIVLVLCFCCVIAIIIAAATGIFSANSLDFTFLPAILPI